MADTNPTHQAGGGASGSQRTVESVNEHMLAPLRRIFASHAGTDGKWGKDQLRAFAHEVQRHDLPSSPEAPAAAGGLLDGDAIDFAGFLRYMTSSHTAANGEHKPVDLSWPLSSYFISSSHNTYLSGNQLYSDSTTEAYTNVLLRGCRCVEIDVWDGEQSDSDDDSSIDGAQEHQPQEKKQSRPSRLGTIRQKLPGSLASRLDRSRFGKILDERVAEKDGAAVPAAAGEGPKVADNADAATAEAVSRGVVEPRVLHGYTLTKEITFREVCVAIEKSAFAVTDTPLIVSLEVHCNAEQQAIMVQIMKEVWAKFLVLEPEGEPEALPSPAELKNKIIVKVKYAPPGQLPEDDDGLEEEEEEEEEGEDVAENATAARDKTSKPKKVSKIIQELSRMGFYCRGVSFKSFDQHESTMPTHIYSLAENKWVDNHTKRGSQLWEHNRKYLMRAYPSGLRINSSNLNPAPFWGCGTQIVALNWQQTDEGTMLNEGMFAGTGGYVLKPQGFLPDLPGRTSGERVTTKTLNLALTFLAAQKIPLPPGDTSDKGFEPYIKAELHVDSSESQRGGPIVNNGHEREGDIKVRTRTHRGSNIDLGDEKLEFRGISGLIEELTFIRFTIRDDEIGRDDLAAWACVRLDRLGEGYRFVHLLDMQGRLTEGSILIKVEKELVQDSNIM